ncbi:type VII secretion protein EccCa [Arthrobacter jiangjiafuii]|uniref:Type VII secretion protein EccCa n=1 Tax=Arthrobacter jiangjiafuii TaxID=2817475 RepID=A0A975M6R2_9MICC|nr:type VII secretion protein EccCa [Arthrobacter jiangjiafuii]MBP3044006.1 type VII secretion protein EccCa [Arthrobacter jiangjiafuii]QWC10996.1 type VII secretion protein EccCa [Arthrobacter jiangjiafuii]
MTVKVLHRPARTTVPARGVQPFALDAPPMIPDGKDGLNLLSLVPLLGAAASMTVMMLFRGSALAAVGALMMILTVLASLGMMLSQRGRQGRQRREERENYLEYLERARAVLSAEEQAARRVARVANPPPGALFDVVRNSRRVWERRRSSEDFLQIRIGTGTRRCRSITVADTGPALARADTFMTSEVEILKRRYESGPGLPLTVPLDCGGNVSVIGSREFVLQVARLLLVQGAALHSPEDLQLALTVPEDRREGWEWATWLPHLADQQQHDGAGPLRRVAHSAAALAEVLGDDLLRRTALAAQARKNFMPAGARGFPARLLVVSDSYGELPAGLTLPDPNASPGAVGLTAVFLVSERGQEPGDVALRISEDDTSPDAFILEDYRADSAVPVVERGVLDPLPKPLAEALARELAPLRLSPDSLEHPAAEDTQGFVEMLRLPRSLDHPAIRRLWTPRGDADFLRVPVGADESGRPVLLDLKESAQFGQGPHGLCVGATGSGKSELLRSLVVGLLTAHSPEVLAMVLVDYKGGATFAPFAAAPHVAGVITNLFDDASLIDRVHASLSGEIKRRQEVLKAAGNLANISEYRLYRQEQQSRGQALAPLPHLVVIIDEFGELLAARPDFIDLFLSIGRIGRSIGVHLLLSSQRIEAGKLRGLDTYLSYRIGLRTLTEDESRTVLGTPDAFHLPPVPGFGYLLVDTSTFTKFKAGYVSGPLAERTDTGPTEDNTAPTVQPVPRYAAAQGSPAPASPGPDPSGEPAAPSSSRRVTGPTVLSALMDTMATFPRAVDPIWLPPLPRQVALDAAAGGLLDGGNLRLASSGPLRVPVGLLDDPARQWQGAWELDLAANGGNTVIVGGPQSGKSTALRTIVASLALTRSPAEVGIYALDLLGSGLSALEGLPHVGGVAVRTRREVVRRTVEELLAMLAHREQIFERRRIDSLAALRRLSAEGRIPELASADIVLVLDGYGQLGDEFEEIEKPVHALISRGAGYGIHVLATCSRLHDIRIAQQGFFGNRIELRLADPGESIHGRKLAEAVSADSPGRALTDAKLQGQFALPRLAATAGTAGTGGTAGTPDGVDLPGLVAAVAASTRERAVPVRVLPAVVAAGTAPTPAGPAVVPLGLRETDLGVESLDLHGRERHLLVLGDDGAGKTNVLRSVIRRLTAQHGPDGVIFAVFDPRRSLTGEVPAGCRAGYATNAVQAGELAATIAGELAQRSAAPAAGIAGLPRMVLVIDDYDILAAGGSSPLGRLIPYLSLAPELGLHAVLSRRVRGVGRGSYEPFFTSLRDSGSAALVLSGDRAEGTLLGGVRAQSLPPGRAHLVQPGRPVQVLQLFLNEEDGAGASADAGAAG